MVFEPTTSWLVAVAEPKAPSTIELSNVLLLARPNITELLPVDDELSPTTVLPVFEELAPVPSTTEPLPAPDALALCPITIEFVCAEFAKAP